MRSLLLLSFLVFVEAIPTKKNYFAQRKLHALLVAGSNGIENYRHQADVAHAYHLLISNGVPPGNIVVMMYDDIANNPNNPTPGQLRNAPNGPDYYQALKIDYRKDDVHVDNFVAVLTGDMKKVKGKNNNGRVLQTGADDNIFLFYADHGAPGLVSMPVGRVLTKSTFQDAIKKATFNQMSVYIEACESGSMLQGMENNKKVFGLTASTATQSSWACNCYQGTCYGDEFSVQWITDSEKHNLNSLDLENQFIDVRRAVHSSTVCRFGDTKLNNFPVSHFQGEQGGVQVTVENINLEGKHTKVQSRDVPIYYYQSLAEKTKSLEEKKTLLKKIDEILEKRVLVDIFIKEMINHLRNKVLFTDAKDDNSCYEKMIQQFERSCHPLGQSPYLASELRVFMSLAKGRNCSTLVEELNTMCTGASFTENKEEKFI